MFFLLCRFMVGCAGCFSHVFLLRRSIAYRKDCPESLRLAWEFSDEYPHTNFGGVCKKLCWKLSQDLGFSRLVKWIRVFLLFFFLSFSHFRFSWFRTLVVLPGHTFSLAAPACEMWVGPLRTWTKEDVPLRCWCWSLQATHQYSILWFLTIYSFVNSNYDKSITQI